MYKNSDYNMYEYRNLYFGWEDLTCSLESSPKYIVKDVKNDLVIPINDVDAEKCSPYLTKRCKVSQ